MAIPKINVLTKEEVESIHLSSLNILEHVGVYLPKKEVLNMLDNQGAQIDYKKNIAKIPSHVVEEYIHKAPSEITLYARDPNFVMTLKPGNIYFSLGGGPTQIIDMKNNVSREASLNDLKELIKIADALNNFSQIGEVVVPSNVPPELSTYYIWVSLLKNTRKNVIMYVGDAGCVRDGVRMASIVVGSEEELVKKPIIFFSGCIGQPLTYEKLFLEGFIEVVKHRIPLMVFSGVMAGATSPVTLAGTLALSNAEVLSGIMLAQMISPGTPVVYSNWSRIFDMKSGNVSFGSPEFTLFRIAVSQLAQRYNIPICNSGFQTDSKLLDAQNGFEQYNALISLLAGSNLILGGTMDGANLVDPLSWVVDDELAAGFLRVMKGLQIDHGTLALDVIQNVGPGLGHNFLAVEHTHRNLKKEHWLDYKIMERRPLATWKKNGAKECRQRAKEILKEKLKSYIPEPLPVDIQKKLDAIIKEAKTKLL